MAKRTPVVPAAEQITKLTERGQKVITDVDWVLETSSTLIGKDRELAVALLEMAKLHVEMCGVMARIVAFGPNA